MSDHGRRFIMQDYRLKWLVVIASCYYYLNKFRFHQQFEIEIDHGTKKPDKYAQNNNECNNLWAT